MSRHRRCAAPGALSIPRPRRRQPHRHRRLLPARCSASSPGTRTGPLPVADALRFACHSRRFFRSPASPANRSVLRDGPGGGPVPGHRCRIRRTALPTSAPSPSRSGHDHFSADVRAAASTVPVSVTRAASGISTCSTTSRKKFPAKVATTNRFPVRSVSRTGLRHRRKFLLVPLPAGASVALPVRALHRVAFRSRSRVASASPLKRRQAPSLRSDAVPNRSRCAPSFSLISTPGGVFSHTRRTFGALLCKRALDRHNTASTATNQQPVVPGEVAHSGVTNIALILPDYLNRDVTVATPVHGGCPMVATVFQPCH